MILLFKLVPGFMRSADTHWVYGRHGVHDVPPGENPSMFAMRGTLASDRADLEEVLERELTSNPK